jgi:hypothetical protein
MTDDELSDAIDGLHAYDSGCTDSGIHDPDLKEKVRQEIQVMPCPECQLFPDRLARILRDSTLSDKAIKQGYGIEDFLGVLKWVEDLMGWDCSGL